VYVVTGEAVSHYLPAGHQAEVRGSTEALPAVADAVGQDAAANAPALVVITGTPGRLKHKYLLRAERYTTLEAGHAAQNVLLAATALGLAGVTIGSFDQAATARALALPMGEEPIYVIPIGVPVTDAQ
jgi:SagB-type dehydrogenase family enzyme